MDSVDVDSILGYRYYQFGYMGNSFIYLGCWIELERSNSYCEL